MSEINSISKVEGKNIYQTNTVKKSEQSNEFESYLGETKSMDEIFKQAAAKYNVSVDLLKAIGKAESNFDAKAVSRCGAQGVMQLMPATAKELGVTDSFDAEQNIMGGAKYIAGLLKKYDGNTKLALAAYNAGSGNVAKYNGIPPFEETQNYVKKVINYMGEGNIQISEANNRVTVSGNRMSSAATAPIQRNLSFLLTPNTDSNSDPVRDLDSLFSYEDYMKFIDLFLEEDKNEEKEKENKKTESISKEISINVPMMNLLRNPNIF